ncbi:MAG: 5'-methylthioadenosine/adenosylhomocysteine nucleosidase [Ruminococcus sp.]|nr:5'-methylthioadenosine/adenosylhomocysteine nucleosidase [Ruminococcus sp.]
MIGIICAMQIEADGILALAQNTREETINDLRFISGTLNGKEIVTVVCGVGKVNAAMCAVTLINRYAPELVINSGVAGALSPLVSIGDMVIATKTVEHDMNTTALGDKQGEISFPDGKVTYFVCDKNASSLLAECARELPETKTAQGIIASGDIFVSDRRKRLLINDRFGAVACEMEGAAIGHVCHCCRVPYAVLRAISDDMDENKGVDFVRFCALAAEKTVAVIDAFTKAYG